MRRAAPRWPKVRLRRAPRTPRTWRCWRAPPRASPATAHPGRDPRHRGTAARHLRRQAVERASRRLRGRRCCTTGRRRSYSPARRESQPDQRSSHRVLRAYNGPRSAQVIGARESGAQPVSMPISIRAYNPGAWISRTLLGPGTQSPRSDRPSLWRSAYLVSLVSAGAVCLRIAPTISSQSARSTP